MGRQRGQNHLPQATGSSLSEHPANPYGVLLCGKPCVGSGGEFWGGVASVAVALSWPLPHHFWFPNTVFLLDVLLYYWKDTTVSLGMLFNGGRNCKMDSCLFSLLSQSGMWGQGEEENLCRGTWGYKFETIAFKFTRRCSARLNFLSWSCHSSVSSENCGWSLISSLKLFH